MRRGLRFSRARACVRIWFSRSCPSPVWEGIRGCKAIRHTRPSDVLGLSCGEQKFRAGTRAPVVCSDSRLPTVRAPTCGMKKRSKQVSAELSAALESAAYRFNPAKERPHRIALAGELPKAVYSEFKEVLAALGGVWERGSEEHGFPIDPRIFIERVRTTGALPALNPLDYFPTPAAIVHEVLAHEYVDRIFAVVEWRRSSEGRKCRVLEPSAGTGAFADALAQRLGGKEFVLCCEANPVNARILREKGYEVVEGDFLAFETDERFPLIVMNPPFAGRTWKKHLEHALAMRENHGTVACIVPKSAFEMRTPDDRHWVRTILSRSTFEHHPEQSFAETGTNVDTLTLFIEDEKPRRPTEGHPSEVAWEMNITLSNDYHASRNWSQLAESLFATHGPALLTEDMPVRERIRIVETGEAINDRFLLAVPDYPQAHLLLEEDWFAIMNHWLGHLRVERGLLATPKRPRNTVQTCEEEILSKPEGTGRVAAGRASQMTLELV